MKVNFKNYKEAKSKLRHLVQNGLLAAPQKAVDEQLGKVFRASQEKVPVRLRILKKTGNLKPSLGKDTIEGSVGYGVPGGKGFYAAIVEGRKGYLRKSIDKSKISKAIADAIVKGSKS